MKSILYTFVFVMLFGAGLRAATITSTAAGGNWSAGSTWVGGVIPSNLGIDDVIIAGPVVQNTPASVNNLTINPGVNFNRSQLLVIYANFTNNGIMSGSGVVYFRGAGAIISGTGAFVAGGDWYIQEPNITVAAGTNIAKANFIVIASNDSFINNGTISLTTESIKFSNSLSSYTNGPNSSLDQRGNFSNLPAILNFTAPNNTLRMGVLTTQIPVCVSNTYHNLIVYGGGTKVMAAAFTINGNLTINSTTTRLNAGGFSFSVAGNWTNASNNDVLNLSTVTFNGAGTQTISRTTGTERFNMIDVSTTGTVLLACSLRVDGDFFLNSGTLDVSASNHVIDFRGSGFYDNATFNARFGTFLLRGTGPQTLDGFASTNFWNITLNNAAGATVNFTKNLNNLLTITLGNFDTGFFGSLILNATSATQYGRIGPVPAGSSLLGSGWSAEGYVDGPVNAYWQYFSTPINGNTLQDWDGDTRFYMSGTGGNDGNACCPTFFSVRTYNTVTNTYTNITSVGTPLVRGQGYMIWTGDNMSQLTAPLVFDSRGTPNFGTFSYPVTAGGLGGGYNLAGNPYACPINFSSVVTASGNLFANFLVLQENGSYATNPNGGVIAPHQGFLCAATASGNMVFNESHKNITSIPNLIREIDPDNYLRINLSNVMNGLGGEAVVQFKDDAVKEFVNTEDLPFIASPYDLASNIWTMAGDNDLLLNAQNNHENEIVIPLTVKPGIYGRHTLMFQGLSRLTAYNCALLENVMTGEVYNLAENNVIDFDVKMPGVEMPFRLRFKNNGDCRGQQAFTFTESLNAQVNVFNNGSGLRATFGFTEMTDVKIEVFNTLGQLVCEPQQLSIGAETVSIPAPKSDNIYLIRISTANETITKKIFY